MSLERHLKCDRCGNLRALHPDRTNAKERQIARHQGWGCEPKSNYDLCPKCVHWAEELTKAPKPFGSS
jgi:Fe2+ or Zn2+ uptake regulation protein